VTTAEGGPVAGTTTRPWQDTSLPAAERVERLLAVMTLAEKVAQLGSRWVGNDLAGGAARVAGHQRDASRGATGAHPESHTSQGGPAGHPESPADGPGAGTGSANVAPLEDVFATAKLPPEEAFRHGLGQLTRVYGRAPGGASPQWCTRSA
jgi:hypothetical protein